MSALAIITSQLVIKEIIDYKEIIIICVKREIHLPLFANFRLETMFRSMNVVFEKVVFYTEFVEVMDSEDKEFFLPVFSNRKFLLKQGRIS